MAVASAPRSVGVGSPGSVVGLSGLQRAEDVVGLLAGLPSALSQVDPAGLGPDGLDALTRAVRAAQRGLEALIMRIGVAAEQLAADGRGRGAHASLLGDGRSVQGRTARREADRAVIVREFDLVGRAVKEGRIGAPQVDLFTQAHKGLEPEQRRKLNTAGLVEAAASEPVDVFAARIRRAVETIKGDGGLGHAKAQRDASSWKSWIDHRTGMGHLHGEFDPERFESICNAVDAQVAQLANEGGVAKTHNLAARAAFELLTGRGRGGTGVPHISVVVDYHTFTGGAGGADALRETAGGRPMPPETVARLACDAVIRRVVLDKRGVPINVGRRHRTATDAQWSAIRAIYRSCVWNGCDRPLSWCQLHHIHEWEHGGLTDLCNLIPLCSEHHHAVHEGGWRVRLRHDRTLDVHSPDGTFQFSCGPDRRPPDAVGWPGRPESMPAEPDPTITAETGRHRRQRQPAQPAGP